MKALYFDCFSGVSGDMILGALIDAGASFENISGQLKHLGIQDYELKVLKDRSYGITGSKFQVIFDEHYLPLRNLSDISRLIEESSLPADIKDNAAAVFLKLAGAEALVHGVPLENVHFHELGAIDTIIDIVGTLLALDELGIEKIYCSPLPISHGYVRCSHGIFPVPAPATAEILKGFPIRFIDIEGELVTPTGAAIVTVLSDFSRIMPGMKLIHTGYGLGQNDYGIPNALRVFIGEYDDPENTTDSEPVNPKQEITVLQTNIDDLNPEILAFAADKLLNYGAIDVSITPLVMKKGRSGCLLTVLCFFETRKKLIDIIFKETTSLGIRVHQERRVVLPRQEICVETEYGPVRVKISATTNREKQISPEYEDCRKIASEKDIPLRVVYDASLQAARSLLKESI
ncbi:MAG TPA: nickel pincer cofactor biosynthesis protein LarC [Desulfotomaculum sp.]|nr:MAG: hypothetical protein XD84_2096 [Desulfotomaculum sp. 46_80]KUK85204.1 MAG: hypothetical protein XE00_0147 [Desulfofundulus kuznetsovii]HAG10532.1 nickel pincer cofactor biosynthesis protein LarC [Desulfotomaculum sp.]HBY03292.1 nickel pincer cofactor biosynthesis protein LarC [Desulfotomaculum sp.]